MVLISCLFFEAGNIIILYAFYELCIFPILFMILGYGYQIEKIRSIYYLIFYTCVSCYPTIFIILRTFDFVEVYFRSCYS